jgi:nicotinamidase-related amidase
MIRAAQLVALALLAVNALQSQSPALAQNADDLTVPDPVAVSLDPSTTTWLAIDFLQSNCAPTPACVATLPAMAQALEAARAAKAHVVYSVHAAPDNAILPDVAPMPNERVFVAIPGDKFFNSDLEQILKQAGTRTLVLTGFSSNSGVLYTAAAATQRGYTVVVAEDGIAGPTDLATPVALWQMIHAPSANVENAPLQAKAVTLSRTDLITYE